jgi:hypothetical protein
MADPHRIDGEELEDSHLSRLTLNWILRTALLHPAVHMLQSQDVALTTVKEA